MRIALDAMGGDFAPDVNIEGAVQCLDQLGQDDQVILVGPQGVIESKLSALAQTGTVSAWSMPQMS